MKLVPFGVATFTSAKRRGFVTLSQNGGFRTPEAIPNGGSPHRKRPLSKWVLTCHINDEVLCDGGITLPILENKIDAFIAKYKA